MNLLEMQSVKILRPENGDIVWVKTDEAMTYEYKSKLHQEFAEVFNKLHPDKEVVILVSSNVDDIQIIRNNKK